jgi:glutamate/tyrosine decarboxylase-like PLP-dependent enzyme
MLDDMMDYLEHIRERPVWQPIPDDTRQAFNEALPRQGHNLAQTHQRFMTEVLPYAVGNTHPRFMGWVHGGGTPVGMLAEMLAGGLNANLGGRDQMPIAVERQIAVWMRELFGFPQAANGLFVTGSSKANWMGVLLARTHALGLGCRSAGLARGTTATLSAYAATSAHSCIADAMDTCGLGTQALRRVPVNEQHQMDTAALLRMIAADRAEGAQPFLVVASAGTVDTGALDNLQAIADIARAENLWFHVDGALGALGMFSPRIAPLLRGIERADSVALDFHKWGQVPYDAGYFLARDGNQLLDTFSSPAAYLSRHPRGLAAGSPWPCDLGPDLSRGFQALKTWFTLMTYGTDRLGAAMDRSCALARYLEQRVASTGELQLMAPVALNIVCFRLRCDHANAVNAELVADLQTAGIAVPSTTTINGQTVIRCCLVNHRTTTADLDALIEATLHFGRQRAQSPILQG